VNAIREVTNDDIGLHSPPRRREFAAQERLLDRELSWLAFNRRVLELAASRELPLLERVKLCAIVSSNLDEFFAVRVARLRYSAEHARQAVRRQVVAMQASQDALFLDDIRPALAERGIRLLAVGDCSARERALLAERFRAEVEPLLTPIAIGATAPAPPLPSLTLCVAATLKDGDGTRRHVRVNLPPQVPRFLALGAGRYVATEEAIVHFLPLLATGTVEAHAFLRVTRQADLRLAADVPDLRAAVAAEARGRDKAEIVRLELTGRSSPWITSAVAAELELLEQQIYRTDAPLALSGLAQIAEIDRPELAYAPWSPTARSDFQTQSAGELFKRIRHGDLLVHHPYDAFDTTVGAFTDAAREAQVAAIKSTVYRTGNPSPTLTSLIDSAQRDTAALSLVEVKARFDERRNVAWSYELERNGVVVVNGVRDLKVHAKLTLLVREEAGGLRRYAHVGTGNYHATNAATYEDIGLFTADPEITADVADVFNAATAGGRPTAFRKLLVAPWFMREGLLAEITRVSDAARAGRKARIRIKVNSLADTELVNALYGASAAGATVEIVTRGICTLRPGVPGLSESITVRSVLGRFLEHSRFLSFDDGRAERTWVGSADLMSRNLDRRIEVLAPVEDSALQAEIAAIFETLFADNQSSWQLDANGDWARVRPGAGHVRVSAQETLMEHALT
jgi:polyphosphate kinase